MAYIGKNPRLKSIVSSGDTLANLTAEPRVAGRLVYATDEGKFYFDDGVDLTEVGSGSGGGGLPLMSKGSLLTSDGSVNGEESIGSVDQILVPDPAEDSGLKWADKAKADTVDPVAADDAYSLGSLWLNTSSGDVFICVDNTAAAAVWTNLTSSGGGGMNIPTSVIATTGSYTVPVGKSVILRASVSGGRSVAIDGTTIMAADSLSWSTQRVSASPVRATTTSGTTPVNSTIVNAAGYGNSPQGAQFSNSTAYNRNATSQTFNLPEGTVISGNGYKLIEVY